MPKKTRTLKEMKKEVINEFVTYWQHTEEEDLDEIYENITSRFEKRMDARHKLARSKIDTFLDAAKKDHDIIILRNVIVLTGLEFPWIDYTYSSDPKKRQTSWNSLIPKLGERLDTFENKLKSAPLNLWMGAPLENRERSTKYDEHETPEIFGFKPSTPTKPSSKASSSTGPVTPFSKGVLSVVEEAKKTVKVKNIDDLILNKILDKNDFDAMTKAGEKHYKELAEIAKSDGDKQLEDYWKDRAQKYWLNRLGGFIIIF